MLKRKEQKKNWKRRRIRHAKSILQEKDGTCYLCMKLHEDYRIHKNIEEHHAFPGVFGRRISEENGFKVYLCPEHHRTSAAAVHANQKNMRLIQQDAQREYEKTHTRDQWMKLIGKNYMEDDHADGS